MEGIYLVEPHGRLIYDGKKTSIAKAKEFDLVGERIVVSKEGGEGLAYGVAGVGEAERVTTEDFISRFDEHRVSEREHQKWWATATHLHLYPIESFEKYDEPRAVEVPPNTQTIMPTVKFTEKEPDENEPNRPYTEEGRPRKTDDPVDSPRGSESDSKDKEANMPWTVANPPSCAKNWTDAEKKKCVPAANAVIAKGGKEQDAIFACIRAAGKTKHPGGEEKARGEGQGVGEKPQTDGGTSTCVCPECGAEAPHERGTPCTETKCPKCGTPMQGKAEKWVQLALDGTEESSEDWKTLTDISDLGIKGLQEVTGIGGEIYFKPIYEEPDEASKVVTAVKEGIASAMVSIKELLAETFKRETPSPTSDFPIAYKTHEAKDGRVWLELWTTNSYQDRDGEFFRKGAIQDFVDRHEDDDVKGEFWYTHTPGTKFGTIRQQAVVADRFLVQLGPFDDTPIGNAFKEFFTKYPNSHPVMAPKGWAASHGYNYIDADRKADGIYNWFETKESSVLPFDIAANQHNPPLEVLAMNDKQKAGLALIGEEVGNPELVNLIIAAGESKRKELDGLVEHKAKKDVTESATDDSVTDTVTEVVTEVPAEDSVPTPDEPGDTPIDVPALAKQIGEALQLDGLSELLKAQSTTLGELASQSKLFAERLDSLEQDDEHKVAQKQASLPRYSWFNASKAAETVLETGSKLTTHARTSIPAVISNVASSVAANK